MREFLKLLHLSDDAIDLYMGCLESNFLTFNEIHSFKLNLSQDNITSIIDILIENQMLIKIEADNPKFLSQYMAIPPFFIINSTMDQIKEDFASKNEEGSAKSIIEHKISEVFQNQNKIELDNVYKDFQVLKESVNKDIINVNNELEKIVKESNEIESIDILKIFKNEIDILKIFKEKIDKLHKLILLKRNNIDLDLKSLEKSISTKVGETFQNLAKKSTETIEIMEEFIENNLKSFFGKNKVNLAEFWPINSNRRIFEEIFNLMVNTKEYLYIIVPNLKDYINREVLLNISNNFEIIIISTESHNNPLVKEFVSKENIKYLRLKNNSNKVIVNSDNSYLIFGIDHKTDTNTLNNFTGFGTIYLPLINLMEPIFSKIVEVANPPKEAIITNNFNQIIENINDLKGKKISKLLQTNLDLLIKKKKKSLDILELKLLITKLRSIYAPLNDVMKKEVIDKIEAFNKEFSNLELILIPELQPPPGEEVISASIKEELSLSPDKLNEKFNLFLEELPNLKGTEISTQIDHIIELSLKFQGLSDIIGWKEELKSKDSLLTEKSSGQIKHDIKSWKEKILPPVSQEEEISKAGISEPINLDELEYTSPALEEISSPEEEETPQEEIQVTDIFNEISQNLNTFKGFEISRRLQDIMDIVLETKGYSLKVNDMREWISKLRMIREPLEDEIKNEFSNRFARWREILE